MLVLQVHGFVPKIERGCDGEEFGESLDVFRAVRPLLGRNDVVEGGDLHHRAIHLYLFGATYEVFISLPGAVAGGHVAQHIEVTGVGTPG